MTIFFSKIPIKWKEKDIRTLAEIYGNVTDINIPIDHRTRQSKGYAFIDFENDNDAIAFSHALNGVEYEGRAVIAEQAAPRTNVPSEKVRAPQRTKPKAPIDMEKMRKKLPPWKRKEY
jgi:RNA recognition motif-containing protein